MYITVPWPDAGNGVNDLIGELEPAPGALEPAPGALGATPASKGLKDLMDTLLAAEGLKILPGAPPSGFGS